MAKFIKNYRHKGYNIVKEYSEAGGVYYNIPGVGSHKHFKTLTSAKSWLNGFLKKKFPLTNTKRRTSRRRK